jgi:spectinomycin phosphotransferase
MLEKPDIPDEAITAAVQEQFGLPPGELLFLPLGYDVHTAVYRYDAGEAACFLKLRRPPFDPASAALPRFLAQEGVSQVIAPLSTRTGQPWGELGDDKLILYPFIPGEDGYHADLTDGQWVQLGAAMRRIHDAQPPPGLLALIPQEDFTPAWREDLARFQALVQAQTFEEPVAARLAAFMRERREEIGDLIRRSGELAGRLQASPPAFRLCHSDLHPGNLLITGAGDFYIVDWDQPRRAPRELDLFAIGGGDGRWSGPRVEALFYEGYRQGYDPVDLDRAALAYCRFERIVVDLAEFTRQLLLTEAGGEDRLLALGYFTNTFRPGGDLEAAYATEER